MSYIWVNKMLHNTITVYLFSRKVKINIFIPNKEKFWKIKWKSEEWQTIERYFKYAKRAFGVELTSIEWIQLQATKS